MHALQRKPIDCLPEFLQGELDVYVFMEITSGMGVDGNRREWVL